MYEWRKGEIKRTLILPKRFCVLGMKRSKTGNVPPNRYFFFDTRLEIWSEVGAHWLVWEGEWHPGEPCCLVYQLGSNVEDLVNGELINCLFSPSFPIDDAVFEPLRGEEPGGKTKCEVRHYGQENNAARNGCTRVRVCVQTCMWFIVNNVALQPTRASEGGYFCQHAHVSHRGLRWLLCLSVCTQKPKPNERHKGLVCGKKKKKRNLERGHE